MYKDRHSQYMYVSKEDKDTVKDITKRECVCGEEREKERERE
jgi:hypothetical protein